MLIDLHPSFFFWRTCRSSAHLYIKHRGKIYTRNGSSLRPLWTVHHLGPKPCLSYSISLKDPRLHRRQASHSLPTISKRVWAGISSQSKTLALRYSQRDLLTNKTMELKRRRSLARSRCYALGHQSTRALSARGARCSH
jgi:hypothetical protein